MHKFDVTQLANALNALAEALDRKPVTPKALEVWFDTLKEFPTERVMGLLSSWAKYHGKFPAPAEVWKAVNDVGIEERERQAAAQRAELRQPVRFAPSEGGKKAMAAIRTIMGTRKPSAIGHWQNVLQTAEPESIGHEYATQALAILAGKRRVIREPGEDEAEAA